VIWIVNIVGPDNYRQGDGIDWMAVVDRVCKAVENIFQRLPKNLSDMSQIVHYVHTAQNMLYVRLRRSGLGVGERGRGGSPKTTTRTLPSN
jgi:hypothetical protein